MKKTIPKFKLHYLNKLLWTWLLGFLTVNLSFAKEAYSQEKDLSKVYLSIHTDDASILDVFQVISDKTNFAFAFDEENIVEIPKQTLNMDRVTLLAVLEVLSKNTDLRFKSVNSIIHVSRENTPKKKEAEDKIVKGQVTSASDGLSMPGVTVMVKGTQIGTATDADGFYTLAIPDSEGVVLRFSFIGYKSEEALVGSQSTVNVSLQEDLQGLDEVVVVGFGKQKKGSLVSSVTSVNVKELQIPSSNLTHAIAGKVAGVISFQQSGEPGIGTDNSTFFIRGLSTFGTGKIDPLILIDGIESTPLDMARLQPDDISDFSVLKDAAASSIFGARGANGVVLINTKSGEEGKLKVSFRAENRISTNTRNFQLADNITYMQMANESATARSPLAISPYSQFKINSTRDGGDPNLFPNNNWIDKLIKPYTVNQGYNINLSGGTSKGRYFLAATYNRDNGILNVEPINNFNNNIRLNNYSIRSNIDINLTPTTLLIARIYGQFDDYTGPIGGGGGTFSNALNANPVMFPSVYPREKMPFLEHPLFGSARSLDAGAVETTTMYVNPYAEMVKGYQVNKSFNLNPQLEIHQDLDFITEGLRLRVMTYAKRRASVSMNRFYNPFFYSSNINQSDGSYTISVLNDGSSTSIGTPGTEYLNYTEGEKLVESTFWLQGAIDYNRTFGLKHDVGAMLVSYIQHYEAGNPGSLILSLPNRNNGVSGRFTYGFDDRYLAEFNFGYNGSERFEQNNRFGFFPSAGIGYLISNEPFFVPIRGMVSNLKFRATYGIVGNDQIGARDQRFLYMSNVNLNDAAYGYSFGRDEGAPTYSRPGVSISRYANPLITWEKSKQLNVGMDLGLFNNSFELVLDVFRQQRSQILQNVTYIDNAAGLMATPFSNYGKAETKGLDLMVNYSKTVAKKFRIDFRGTFTYASSKAIRVDELDYDENLVHLARRGYSLSQQWGYVAERLFVDLEEVANSPVQFGDAGLLAGDIKYRDINEDGVINTDDMVPIGYPTQPEVIFGFGSTIRYKQFDFNFYFQGAARVSFFINSEAIQPFYQANGYQTGLLQAVADDYWSEENRNVYAFWPRLSDWRVNSNNQTSTWWLRNGSFLRLKNVDIGYTIKEVKKLGIKSGRIYLSSINLLMFSKFKMWDVEMGGNGLGYPIQSVYNLGLSINL
ncbi:TonB-dependent receptor [Algoriphagus sp. Y33]|uniref:SusC/RagA family TonB-linked outer membrane protein n=1 Tax=Algoriphagus sp. Y33 TaxID=2772483 RepID=UPI001CE1E996|nr:TonB-dependent receptor [Algoriphagus sp. Y33]